MLRDMLVSITGHIVVFGGVIISSMFHISSTPPSFTVHQISTVSPQQIQQLLAKSAPKAETKSIVPQVQIKPDERIPNVTRRRKQVAKQTEQASDQKKSDARKGSPVQGIQTDTEFDYPDYLIEMRDRIYINWRYPNLRESLMSTVYFRIAKDGRILSIKVEKSSSNISFDRSAWDAIQKSNPFGPLPENFAHDELGVHFNFIFEP
ncbi:TonB family protein [bacterium]|nr:TonB family protein [bacterium]